MLKVVITDFIADDLAPERQALAGLFFDGSIRVTVHVGGAAG